ncbi:hypothetical protein DYH09_11975 [bacterium CPR1]|nr:hypothetical protein [bacterium CPR1]
MQTASLAYRPSLAPSSAATQTWKNGVVHSDGETDVYEIPSAAPGVAARVELKPILWGILGKEVVATDSQGARLEAHRGWEGFHRTVVTKDPQTGLETVLDPREQTVSVSTPETSQEIPAQHGALAYRESYQRTARQDLDSQGNSRYLSNLRGERETMVVTGPPGMVGAVPVVVEDDSSWQETQLRKGEPPVAHAMSGNKRGEVTLGEALEATIGADGSLVVAQADGTCQSFEMYLRV